MKGKRREYRKVQELPSNASRVKEYADKGGFAVSYVYQLEKLGRIEIVDFHGINFVIPVLTKD